MLPPREIPNPFGPIPRPEFDPRAFERFPIPEFIPFPFSSECQPKILVVTDSFLLFGTTDFGLKNFVDTLKTSLIHSMTPSVKTAHTGAATADYTGFNFTDATLNINKYDVLFLFGTARSPGLPQAQVDVIARFMQAGGGVFATGDHEELGKHMCANIPRVKSMRYWSNPNVPNGSNTTRLSTNDPGVNNQFGFNDQSDVIPQKIYPRYYLQADGLPQNSKPHQLLQHPTKSIIEVLPDHPHEGECVVPDNLTTTFVLNDVTVDEWPVDIGGSRVSPELVALSMSYGGGFLSPTKQPLEPRSFGAIGAYDGHQGSVGRVSVDATWHHFININLDPAGGLPGLIGNADAYDRVHAYFRNIAEWLMPKRVRRCLIWQRLAVIRELDPFPEIWHSKSDVFSIDGLSELGLAAEQALSRFMVPSAIDELKTDLLELTMPDFVVDLKTITKDASETFGGQLFPYQAVSTVVLGAAAATLAQALPNDSDLNVMVKRMGGVEGIEKTAQKNIRKAMKETGALLKKSVANMDQTIQKITV